MLKRVVVDVVVADRDVLRDAFAVPEILNMGRACFVLLPAPSVLAEVAVAVDCTYLRSAVKVWVTRGGKMAVLNRRSTNVVRVSFAYLLLHPLRSKGGTRYTERDLSERAQLHWNGPRWDFSELSRRPS